jgi:hypothetical protein
LPVVRASRHLQHGSADERIDEWRSCRLAERRAVDAAVRVRAAFDVRQLCSDHGAIPRMTILPSATLGHSEIGRHGISERRFGDRPRLLCRRGRTATLPFHGGQLVKARLERLRTTNGPTPEASELLQAYGSALSSGERVMLLAAWAFWNGSGGVTLADVLERLDSATAEPLCFLVMAVKYGTDAVDDWLAEHERTRRTS